MISLHRLLLALASASFFIASAQAQNAGTVTNHAFVIGKGAGTTGYTSLLCGSAQLAVGQAAADPICQTITGDVSLSAAGAITLATVNSNVGSFGSATNCTTFTVNAKGLITAASATTCTPAVGSITGLGTGIATFLATPSSANLRAALTDEVGTGAAYFVGGALGTPASATLTNATGLPLSGLTAQGAFTFVGNNTSGSATPTAVDIAALTSKGSPAASDLVMISDQAASGAWKKVTVSSLASAGSVASINGQTGALTLPVKPQGRLTLQTATPVMTTTQSAKTTIYYTAYQGNQIPIYDGTNMVSTTITGGEISVLTTDATKSPAAIGASKVNDWFVWNDTGTIRLSHGPDWTNDTTRSAGTALVMVNGILLNNASITNGPAASRGTYVGTTRSNGSSQLDWIFGASAAGGTAAWFGVWNAYNRVTVTTTVTDSTASWSTASSATPAALNTGATGSGLNNRISAVHGLAEDGIRISIFAKMAGAAVAFGACNVGFALDATNAFDKQAFTQSTSSGLSVVISGAAENSYAPQIGFHFWQATQSGDGSNVGTVAGGAFEGLSGMFRM